MLEQGSPFLNSSTFILVAAGAQDPQAIALVQEMRKAGLRVTFAETINIAVRASEAAVCVVVLRPDTWKTQAIATAMRAKPACLIPVLAESMELPRGPWTHEAITISNESDQAAQEIIQVVHNYLATRPEPMLRSSTDPLTLDKILKQKNRHRRLNSRPFFTTLLILLIVGLGAALGYRYQTTHLAKSQATISPNLSTLTTVSYPTYSAKTPGPNCDTGTGQWEQANRYKLDKKTEIIDKYTTLQCKSGGSLLTRTGDYGTYSEIFFSGRYSSATLSQHYLVQVEATIISGDTQAKLAIDTHIHANGYGRYSFHVNTLGSWEVYTTSTDGVSYLNRLARGFFPKASKTYTLAIETDGSVMTFSLNGIKVATATDTTYTDNDSIAFGVDDYTATQPISALFSNFQYKELAPSTFTTPQVAATATAQAQANIQATYTAHVPGYGCDQGAGQWQSLADDNTPGTLNCLPNGMQLTGPANAKTITEANFYGLDGHLPQNYKLSARVDVSAAHNGCAGLGTHADIHGNVYAFIICSNGSWEIASVADKFNTLAHGWVNAQNIYQITAMADGSNQSLFINGSLIKTVTDIQFKGTDHLSLLVGLYTSSQPSTATFSDFVFTPLP